MCLPRATVRRPGAAQARAGELALELTAARAALAGAQAAAKAERATATQAVAGVGRHQRDIVHGLRLPARVSTICIPNPMSARTETSSQF